MVGRKVTATREDGERAPVGSIGWRLRRLRLDVTPHVTLAQLAEAAGIRIQSVSDLERGATKNPKPGHLFKFAERLNVNAYYLATGKGPKEPIRTISPEEGELLLIFRDLENDTDRARVIAFAKGLQQKKTPLALVPPSKERAGD